VARQGGVRNCHPSNSPARKLANEVAWLVARRITRFPAGSVPGGCEWDASGIVLAKALSCEDQLLIAHAPVRAAPCPAGEAGYGNTSACLRVII
jgi:hypothetical protein